MFIIILSTIASGLTVGVIGWMVQLGTRVSVLESKNEDLITLINTRFDSVSLRFDSVSQRLDRIEKGMNGFLAHQ